MILLHTFLHFSGALKDNRPHNWCLTEEYLSYLEQPVDAPLWSPDQSYYVSTIKRLVDSILLCSVIGINVKVKIEYKLLKIMQ